MKYRLEMRIPRSEWDSTRALIEGVKFTGKQPVLARHARFADGKYEYAAFKCESEKDFRFVIEHLLPDGSATKLFISDTCTCKKCGRVFENHNRNYKDDFLNRVQWCSECKDAYNARYDGWRDDHSTNRFKGGVAPASTVRNGLTGKKSKRR